MKKKSVSIYSSGLLKKGRAFHREKYNSEDAKAEKTYFQNFQAYVMPKAKLAFLLRKCHEIAGELGNMQLNQSHQRL